MREAERAIEALAGDAAPKSGWVFSYDGRTRENKEVYIDGYGWIRANGCWVSGWRGEHHFGERPAFADRFRIRSAVRSWAKRLSPTPPSTGASE